MTYAEFLALFLVVPVVVLAAAGPWPRRLGLTLAALSVVALLYTAPWDNMIVTAGVWSYGRGHVAGVVIGHVPLEEYVFYVLQVALAGLLTARLLRRFS
ncbi:MAG TPA: lycopene cyclase domain-containing protein [Chloroflexota bacterium]|nr:lycopene cyclase domain-containing protein [Chloroflexota bacterium]